MNSCIAARVDLDQARRFLAVLAEGQPITFQTFDDDGVRKDNALARIVHGSLDASAPTLQQMNARGAGVYWMVNFGDCKGRRAKNVTDVRALFLDLDGAPLAPVLDAGVEPHAVVESSPGRWHVYWAVVGCAPPQFKAAQQALAARFGGDPSVCDLPRVLRVPGFLHSKGERFASRIERLVPMRPYAFGDLLQRLGLDLSLIVPKPVVQIERASGEIVDKVTHPGRHAHLLKWAAQLNWRGVPAEAVRVAVHAENMRVCEPPKTAVEVDAVVADVLKRYGAQHGRDLRQQEGRHMLDAGVAQEADDAASPLFTVVPVADLAHTSPAAPYYWWEGYLPAGVVTLLGAHGGAGKSTLALMLAVCIAQGLPLFGIPTKRGRVAIFSGEDGAELVRHRLHLICRRLGVNPAALAGWLHVIDATAGEPTLFHEVNLKGTKQGATTPSYAALREYVETHQINVLMVDNASDAYDASEIDRSRVRGFMRSLARIAQERAGAVLLLAHVDKGTSRGERTGTESYSGSTAWHNSARSRLYLSRDKDGAGLRLEHQKLNVGKVREPLLLQWPEGGIPQLEQEFGPVVQRIAENTDAKALLRLIHTFHARGEWIATDTRSRYHAVKVLSDEPIFPKRRKPAEVFGMLRDAEQRGLIEREAYRDRNRKEHERWAVTAAGCDLIGVPAPCAPCAPSSEHSAPGHTAQQGAPSAPCSARGVRGDRARARDTAQAA